MISHVKRTRANTATGPRFAGPLEGLVHRGSLCLFKAVVDTCAYSVAEHSVTIKDDEYETFLNGLK